MIGRADKTEQAIKMPSRRTKNVEGIARDGYAPELRRERNDEGTPAPTGSPA
jgi:hypothetical protein